jgi:hypothetical protein
MIHSPFRKWVFQNAGRIVWISPIRDNYPSGAYLAFGSDFWVTHTGHFQTGAGKHLAHMGRSRGNQKKTGMARDENAPYRSPASVTVVTNRKGKGLFHQID